MKKIIAIFVFVLILATVTPVTGTIILDKSEKNFTVSSYLTKEENSPPYVPKNPYPTGEFPVDIHINLSWDGGDPDPDDTVTYYVYFDFPNQPPAKIGPYPANQTRIEYDPGELDYARVYDWVVTAVDNNDFPIEGPIWSFKTILPPEPDLDCTGNLRWVNIKPGSIITGNFTVSNVGDTESLLNWEITEWPNWGNWTFTPIAGEDLKPEEGKITVDVSVVTPISNEQSLDGYIKIKNKQNNSDYCIIKVILNFSKNKQLNFFINYLTILKNYILY